MTLVYLLALDRRMQDLEGAGFCTLDINLKKIRLTVALRILERLSLSQKKNQKKKIALNRVWIKNFMIKVWSQNYLYVKRVKTLFTVVLLRNQNRLEY